MGYDFFCKSRFSMLDWESSLLTDPLAMTPDVEGSHSRGMIPSTIRSCKPTLEMVDVSRIVLD